MASAVLNRESSSPGNMESSSPGNMESSSPGNEQQEAAEGSSSSATLMLSAVTAMAPSPVPSLGNMSPSPVPSGYCSWADEDNLARKVQPINGKLFTFLRQSNTLCTTIRGETRINRDLLVRAVKKLLSNTQPFFNNLESSARSTTSQHLPLEVCNKLLKFSQQLCDSMEQLLLACAYKKLISVDESDPLGMSHFCIGSSQLGQLRVTSFRYCRLSPYLVQFDTGLFKRMRWNVDRLRGDPQQKKEGDGDVDQQQGDGDVDQQQGDGDVDQQQGDGDVDQQQEDGDVEQQQQQQQQQQDGDQQQQKDGDVDQQQKDGDFDQQQQKDRDVDQQQQQKDGDVDQQDSDQQQQQKDGDVDQQQQKDGDVEQQQQKDGDVDHQQQQQDGDPQQQKDGDVDHQQQQQDGDPQQQKDGDVDQQQQKDGDVDQQQQKKDGDVDQQQQKKDGDVDQQQKDGDIDQQQKDGDIDQQQDSDQQQQQVTLDSNEQQPKDKVGETDYYFLCYEIPDEEEENEASRGKTTGLWSIGQWVQVFPEPDTDSLFDWIVCEVPQGKYHKLLDLGREEPSSSIATDYMHQLLLSQLVRK